MKTVKTTLSLVSAGIISALAASSAYSSDLVISGVIDGSLSGGVPKAVELFVVNDIADLSVYGVGSANNGGGSDGQEFTFPAQAAQAGTYIYVASEEDGFTTFFGNAPDFTSSAMGINGDDAVELFKDGNVVDTFGDINVDGNGTAWEYLDGWAYRVSGESANAGSFDPTNWTFSGVDALDGEDNNAGAITPFPIATFTTEGGGSVVVPPEEPIVELGLCGESATLISAIQGSGDESPEVGMSHTVEAVVTGVREGGFFIQEEVSDMDADDATSEGVFVEGVSDVEVGNSIRLHGEIEENFGLTTIAMDSDVQALDCGVAQVADPVFIALPLDIELETVEGMVVSVVDATVTSTSTLWRFGEIKVSDALKRQPSDVAAPLSDAYTAAVAEAQSNLITIEDSSNARFPDTLSFFPNFSYANPIRIGDTVSTSGPMSFGFGAYRINPSQALEITTERDAVPAVTDGNLSIATFNVLNYFNGEITDSGDVTFDFDGNRGAGDETAFALQQSRIVEAIVNLDADVVGLMEIENDGFDENSAIQSLVNAVNAELADEAQYTFVTTTDGSGIGTDAITVGLIYRASVVTADGEPLIVNMPEQQLGDDRLARMRPSLVQNFVHTESEKSFLVAVNHFKSKGSDCAEDTADTSDIDSIQGSCNALRVSAAVTLGEALSDESLPERKIILGDLNAYSSEDPVAVLTDYTPETRGYTIQTAVNTERDEGASVAVESSFGYHNLAKTFDAEGFSYWFFGSEQVGSLDHVLASDAMLQDAVDGTHWNINSVEAFQLQYDQALRFYPDEDGYAFTDVGPYRSSDHDPFIATFNLQADVDEDPVVMPTPAPTRSGGAMGGLLGLLAAAIGFRRRANKVSA